MERKRIVAKESTDLLLSSEVEIKTAELSITIHQENSSVHTILVWGTVDCIEQIRKYLEDNCKNASFPKVESLSEAKYISHTIPIIESVAVVAIHPSGKTIMSIAPSVKEFTDFISDLSDDAYYVV